MERGSGKRLRKWAKKVQGKPESEQETRSLWGPRRWLQCVTPAVEHVRGLKGGQAVLRIMRQTVQNRGTRPKGKGGAPKPIQAVSSLVFLPDRDVIFQYRQ